MHFGDIDLELGGMAHTRPSARDRHGIALEDYLDQVRLRRRCADELVPSGRGRQAAALVSLLAMAARACLAGRGS